jgi:ABC-type nitrate/sulfonate/bicarbonate transport system substrate-binding protein
MVRPEIRGYADLRGKTLGTGQLNAGATTMLQLLLANNGVKKDEYELIALGGSPSRLAALQKGAVAAVLLNSPLDVKAEKIGMRRLGSVDEVFKGPLLVFTVQRNWATANRDTTVRFLQATLRASRWLHDPANQEAAIKILVKAIKASPEDAEAAYKTFISGDNLLGTDLALTPQALDAFLDIRSGKDKTAQKYMDLSYLEKALEK